MALRVQRNCNPIYEILISFCKFIFHVQYTIRSELVNKTTSSIDKENSIHFRKCVSHHQFSFIDISNGIYFELLIEFCGCLCCYFNMIWQEIPVSRPPLKKKHQTLLQPVMEKQQQQQQQHQEQQPLMHRCYKYFIILLLYSVHCTVIVFSFLLTRYQQFVR